MTIYWLVYAVKYMKSISDRLCMSFLLKQFFICKITVSIQCTVNSYRQQCAVVLKPHHVWNDLLEGLVVMPKRYIHCCCCCCFVLFRNLDKKPKAPICILRAPKNRTKFPEFDRIIEQSTTQKTSTTSATLMQIHA